MTELKRHLTLSHLVFYGVGDIVGAGIYALIGKLAAEAGGLAWLSFVVAGLAVLPTALTYAELTGRYPRSGGVAVFAGRAFDDPRVPFVVGFLVLLTGLVSAATSANGFHGYLSTFVALPRWCVAVSFIGFLCWINHRGIDTSSRFNILCVVAEVGGLLAILIFGLPHWLEGSFLSGRGESLLSPETLQGIASASLLAFFASIGFEDICNVSEEVKEPERVVPRAILLCVTITSLIYIGIALTVVSVASVEELGSSSAPLALVAERIMPFFSSKVVALLALFSVSNTALANLIMGSRLLYGMSREGWIFRRAASLHATRQTPTVAIVATFLITLGIALSGTVKVLGQTTSTIMLTLFVIVNLSLLVIRIRKLPPDSERFHFRVPILVPCLGVLFALSLLTQAPEGAFGRSGLLLMIGFVFYLIYRATEKRKKGPAPASP